MANKINHPEALKILGFDHESDLQNKLYGGYSHIINASDVINAVRFLTEQGYLIKQSAKWQSRTAVVGDGWVSVEEVKNICQQLIRRCALNAKTKCVGFDFEREIDKDSIFNTSYLDLLPSPPSAERRGK